MYGAHPSQQYTVPPSPKSQTPSAITKNQVPFARKNNAPSTVQAPPQSASIVAQNNPASRQSTQQQLGGANQLQSQSKIQAQLFKPAPPNLLRQHSGGGGHSKDAALAAAQQSQQPQKDALLQGKDTTAMTMKESANTTTQDREAPPPLLPYPQRLAAAMAVLDGSVHLDAVCCMFELNPLDILKSPDVDIVYK
jgi:hypothetical protein